MEILRCRKKTFESLGEKISKPVLMITVSVLLICQAGSFFIAEQRIRSASLEKADRELENLEATVQEKIMDIRRMLFGIQVNDTFNQAIIEKVFASEENLVYADSRISGVLAVNKGTVPMIANLYVCSPDFFVSDMTILTDRTADYRDSQAYRLYLNSESNTFLGSAVRDDIFIGGRTVVPAGYRYEVPGYGASVAIVANIDQARFNEYLRSEVACKGMIWILDEAGTPIFENGGGTDTEGAGEILQTLWNRQRFQEKEGREIFRHGEYLVGYEEIGGTPWRVVYILSQREEMRTLLGLAALYLLLCGGAALIMVSFVRRWVRGVTKPLTQLAQMMSRFGDRQEEEPFEYDGNDELKILSDSFNQMIEKTALYISQLEEEKQRVKSEQTQKRRAEFKALQAQINPHFLYNTLDSIHWKAEEAQAQEISDMVQALATFFRVNLSKGQEMIRLRDEAAHVESYLRIQQIRYGDKLEYSVQIDEDILDVRLPKLILQPLVENSINHGIREKDGTGTIRITGTKDPEGILLLTVWDNGIGIPEEKLKNLQETLISGRKVHQEGYGIFNVNDRIRLNYGPEYGLSIQSEYGRETVVQLRMPAAPEDEEDAYV